jgi:hypothetical protein
LTAILSGIPQHPALILEMLFCRFDKGHD